MNPFSISAHLPATEAFLPYHLDDTSALRRERPRLLLVDDEPGALASMRALFHEFDYDIVTAGTGTQAMAELRRRAFDLVLLDLRMDDIDGHQVMKFINDNDIDASVIVVSGKSGIGAAIGALRHGARDYVRKPYGRDELLRTVGNALEQRTLEKANRHLVDQLAASERTYRYLVDASPDIIYMLDSDGRFTFVNDRACQILGYERRDLIARHYTMILHEADRERLRHVFNERRAGERASRDIELRVKRGPGSSNRNRDDGLTVSLNSTGMHVENKAAAKPVFVGTYGVARDITARKRAEAVIFHQAYHDILTDLPNRSLFKDRLGQAILHAARNRAELAVMFIDLDRFKLVNDTLGHVKGDMLLQQVAMRLKACIRKGDTLARHGGDEFTIVLSELHHRADVVPIANKFLERLHAPFDLDGDEVHISASIGTAIYPEHGESLDALLRNADMAMYQIKDSGKNGHAIYDAAMHDTADQNIALDRSLHQALVRNELEMHYQPQIDDVDGRIVGAEALIRWNHPVRGLVMPDEFLPFAEESGLIVPISAWVIDTLCRDMNRLRAAGLEGLKFSLNISPQYLERDEFFDHIRGNLQRHGIAPACIEVEITENICIRNPQQAIEQVNRLGQLGVSVAIDDFGTGYSSLAYLHRFPINTIKIDQSFVRQIQDEQGHYPVILAIISISRGLNLHVVAEGVETATQARYLHANGCSTFQGFLYHRPMPFDRFVDLVRAGRAA